MMIEDIKKDFHKSLKDLQESTAKELQALKEKQENTAKQVMEMNKTILELKGEADYPGLNWGTSPFRST